MYRFENHLEQINHRIVLYLLICMALITGFGSAIIETKLTINWIGGFLQNLSSEMFGAIVTFLLFELILGHRNKQEEKIRYQQQLKILVSSRNNHTALDALNKLRAENWLDLLRDEDTILEGANWANAHLRNIDMHNVKIHGINLENADLTDANILGVHAMKVNLKASTLIRANAQNINLQKSNISSSNFTGANLSYADFRGADLRDASLIMVDAQHIDLRGANLKGADLRQSYLRGARLIGEVRGKGFNSQILKIIQLDENTILPDGTKYEPVQSFLQLERFTSEEHPDFWKPHWIQ